MTIRSGEFDRRISIQARGTTKDSFGQQVTTWTEVISCWARIRPMSGRELIAAQAVQAETTHRIEILYRPTVVPAMRAVYQGRIFNIESVIDDGTRHETLTLLCGEGLNQG